jgi:exosortase/archaeosortase family protein
VAHSLVLMLMLLLYSSPALAQDVPPLVLIDVDLHWTVPVYGSVSLSGKEEWQNGVGYIDTTKTTSDRWHVTGTGLPSFGWTNPVSPPQFALVLDRDLPHGEPEIRIPLDGQLINPVVQPGDYRIGDSVFVDPGISVCCPVQGFFAESGHITVLATPEPMALRRLLPRHIYGRELAAMADPILQPLTAWGAAKMLGALQFPVTQAGVFVSLPSVTLEVQKWCSGLVSMKWLTLLAFVIAFVIRASLSWRIAIILAAPFIAVEVNMMRVAGIGAGVELFGYAASEPIKAWAGWGAMVVGVAQLALLVLSCHLAAVLRRVGAENMPGVF